MKLPCFAPTHLIFQRLWVKIKTCFAEIRRRWQRDKVRNSVKEVAEKSVTKKQEEVWKKKKQIEKERRNSRAKKSYVRFSCLKTNLLHKMSLVEKEGSKKRRGGLDLSCQRVNEEKKTLRDGWRKEEEKWSLWTNERKKSHSDSLSLSLCFCRASFSWSLFCRQNGLLSLSHSIFESINSTVRLKGTWQTQVYLTINCPSHCLSWFQTTLPKDKPREKQNHSQLIFPSSLFHLHYFLSHDGSSFITNFPWLLFQHKKTFSFPPFFLLQSLSLHVSFDKFYITLLYTLMPSKNESNVFFVSYSLFDKKRWMSRWRKKSRWGKRSRGRRRRGRRKTRRRRKLRDRLDVICFIFSCALFFFVVFLQFLKILSYFSVIYLQSLNKLFSWKKIQRESMSVKKCLTKSALFSLLPVQCPFSCLEGRCFPSHSFIHSFISAVFLRRHKPLPSPWKRRRSTSISLTLFLAIQF